MENETFKQSKIDDILSVTNTFIKGVEQELNLSEWDTLSKVLAENRIEIFCKSACHFLNEPIPMTPIIAFNAHWEYSYKLDEEKHVVVISYKLALPCSGV